MNRRVVVTGMSGVTAFGNDWQSVEPKLRDCQNATQYMPSYEQYDGLNTKLAAPIFRFLNCQSTTSASKYAAWGAFLNWRPSQQKTH